MATCVDLAGAAYPSRDRHPPLEGRSLVPAFANKPLDREPYSGSTRGTGPSAPASGSSWRNADGPWELYDICPRPRRDDQPRVEASREGQATRHEVYRVGQTGPLDLNQA